MAGPYVTSSEKNYLGFGKQSVKGTGVAPTVFVPYIGEADVEHGMDGDDLREAGVGLYIARSRKSKHDPMGSFSAAWRFSTIGKLAAWFLGADSIAGAGPYDHTLTPAEINTWLSIERNIADEITERFIDTQLSKMTISGDGGGDLMAVLEWLALSPAWQGSPATETYEAVTPFKQDQATYTIDGSVVTNVQKWSMELKWGVDEDLRLSKVTRSYLPKLTIEGTITLTQLLLLPDDYRKVNYGSTSGTVADKAFFGTGAFDVVYDNGVVGAGQRSAQITAPNLEWRTAKPTNQDPDGKSMFLERTGIIKRVSPAQFVTIVAKTSDSAVYV